MEEARQRVARSVQRGEGPVLVIGSAGLGKTMLLEVLTQTFRDSLRVVALTGGQLCTRRALLQMILFQLDLPYRDMDESELRLSLLSYLQPHTTEPRSILLLVDEADALPPRLLEELRALTNISASGQLLVNLVMVGNATLEEQFADPKLDLFSQRIAARCYLAAFGREETFQFVQAQVLSAGYEPTTLFTPDGLEAIFAATDGVPRLINQLGDQLLWTVAETGYSPLDGPIVQQAWSEIQQLPAPWNTQTAEPASSEVEFGELSFDATESDEVVFDDEPTYALDDDDDLPASIPINATQAILSEIESQPREPVETVDVTDEVLEQLNVMNADEPVDAPTARNPFNEVFDSEEIVLDRYSAFESLLLAEAPRVMNQTDTEFSEQLQQFEAQPIAATPVAIELTTPVEPVVVEVNPTEAPIDAAFTTEHQVTPLLATQPAPADPGEVLILEESEAPQTSVVSGQKFRQLFSSLEAGGSEPCFG